MMQALGVKSGLWMSLSFLVPHIPPRLAADLGAVVKEMERSFAKFSSYITELKMDHNDGKNPSEKLDQLLVYTQKIVSYGLVSIYT